MAYILLATFLWIAATGWHAPRADLRRGARLSAVMAAVLALQLWWSL